MIRYYYEGKDGTISFGEVTDVIRKKEEFIVCSGETESNVEDSKIKNMIVFSEKQIIFKVVEGIVTVEPKQVMDNLMLGAESFDIKKATEATMKEYSESMAMLDVSKANMKAFYKRVSQDKSLLESVKKSDKVTELIEKAENFLVENADEKQEEKVNE